MWAALLASCQVWGIPSALNNPPPADTSYTFFPPFLFSLIHPIKKQVTRTRYGHRYRHSSSPACAHTPRAREPGPKLPLGRGEGLHRCSSSSGKRSPAPPQGCNSISHSPCAPSTSPSNAWVQLLAWPQIFSVSSCKSLLYLCASKT